MTENTQETMLVVGGTGKTGRRVAERLAARGLPVRVVSRSSEPRFDWEDPATWAPALQDVESAYIVYYPDLADPGAAAVIRAFAELAVKSGVQRLVLLSPRGAETALPAEQALQNSGADWTILRASWFCQNFDEGVLREPVLSGTVVFPAGNVLEPFIDIEDIAEVAVAALTEDGHAGQIYELTGPRLLTFGDAAKEIGEAAGREVRYLPVSAEEYASELVQYGLPAEYAAFLSDVFASLLDGRNAHLADGVQQVLGREPRDFADFARDAAATGVWRGQ